MQEVKTKMLIIVRRDLNMSAGKLASQAAHAAMSFLTRYGNIGPAHEFTASDRNNLSVFESAYLTQERAEEIKNWLRNSFRKIVVYVNSEKELEEVHHKALDAHLDSHMTIDNGATEFNGHITKTCIAIGPHEESKFVGITDHLPLL